MRPPHRSATSDRKLLRSLAILPTLCLLAANFSSANSFTVTRNGEPIAKIKLPAEPDEHETAAADDLRKYIETMSGAVLEITREEVDARTPAILIGRTKETMDLAGKWLTVEHIGYDGYVIRTYGTTREAVYASELNRLVLCGKGISTRYAVFQFLYLQGCRFYAPHQDGEHVPRDKSVAVKPVSLISKPDFTYRWLWPQVHSRDQEDRDEREQLIATFQEWRVKNGAEAKAGNRYGEVLDTGHNFMTMVPPRKHFRDHPEYFALAKGRDGKMVRGGTAVPAAPGAAPGEMQLCLANKGVQQIFIDKAIARFGKGTGRTFSLSSADTSLEAWCHCDDCSKMSGQDGKGGTAQRMVTFANAIATEVEEVAPGNFFPFHVEYCQSGKPINDDGSIRVKCHPSLVPTFVFTYCPNHGPYDPACSRAGEMRWAMEAWDRVSSQMIVRSYSMWSMIIPNPQTWAIGPRIRFFHDVGTRWYITEMLNITPDNDLSMYIQSRMLWDASQDPDALIEEYFRLYFQEVSGEMKQYYQRLNDIARNSHNNSQVKSLKYFNRGSVGGLRDLLRKAADKAEAPVVKRRVFREQVALDATAQMVEFWVFSNKWKAEDPKTLETAQKLNEAVDKIDEILTKYRDDRILIRPNNDWWEMYRDGARAKLATFDSKE